MNATPIRRADGTEPFNGYLWPTESWWINREHRGFDSRWHFGVVALADGRFATDGTVADIMRKPHMLAFLTRNQAIRTAAAQLIREMRWSRQWSASYGGMTGAKLATAINWVRETVARETGREVPKPVMIQEPPKPTGLELWDAALT